MSSLPDRRGHAWKRIFQSRGTDRQTPVGAYLIPEDPTRIVTYRSLGEHNDIPLPLELSGEARSGGWSMRRNQHASARHHDDELLLRTMDLRSIAPFT